MAKVASSKSNKPNPMAPIEEDKEDLMECEKHMGYKMDPQEALKKILDAEAIRADSKMMAKLQEHVGKQNKVIKSIKEMKAVAQKKAEEPKES